MMSNFNQLQTKTQVFLSQENKNILPEKGVLLGIDYGQKRIGLALSDKDRQISSPFKTIFQLKELDDIIPAKEVTGVIIGLPLQTNGEEGDIAKSVRLFANRVLEKYSLPVFLVDERYTSKFSSEDLSQRFVREKKQKKVLDNYAAARILQRGIELIKNNSNELHIL